MHLIKVVFSFLLLLLALVGSSQTDSAGHRQQPARRLHFSNITQFGLAAGQNPPELQLQTINGVRYGTWFAGLGAGLDYYYSRSITAFIDVRKDLFRNRLPIFIYGDLGINVVRDSEDEDLFWGRREFKNGLYYDAGLGYRIRINNTSAFLINAGYSLKRYSEITYFDGPCTMGPCSQNKQQSSYELRRITVKAGFQF